MSPVTPSDAAVTDAIARPADAPPAVAASGDAAAPLDAAEAGVSDAEADVAVGETRPAPMPMRREDWEVSIGKWTFDENGEATCECKATSSLLYWKKDRPRDFDASVEVMFLTDESSAGIIFRERGEDFYEDAAFYQYEWYTRGSHHDKRLSLMIKNPYWVQIVEPQYPVAPLKTWIELRVRAVGDRIETFLDGNKTFEKKDATFVRTGKIGLHFFQPRPVRLRNWRFEKL